MMLRGAALSLICLGGCLLGDLTGPREHHGQLDRRPSFSHYPQAPAVWDRHFHGDVHGVPVGSWVRYSIDSRDVFEIAVVGEEGGDRWIEVLNSREAPGVSLRRVSKDGSILCAYYSESPFRHTQRQVIEQAPRGLKPQGFEAMPIQPESSVHSEGVFDVEGGEITGCKETVTMEDDLGRPHSMMTAWSVSVPPLYVGCIEGGLVETLRGGVHVKLAAFGAGAKGKVLREGSN